MYEIVIEEDAQKALAKIPISDVRRFRGKLLLLAENPYAPLPFVKPLKGCDYYRLRFGDWRAVYRIENKVLTIFVIEVGNRKDIYRRSL